MFHSLHSPHSLHAPRSHHALRNRSLSQSLRSLIDARAAAEFVPPPCPEIPDPTEEELADVSKCVNRMFLLDPNHLHPDVDYVLDFQRECRPYAEGDFAPNPLFRSINTKKLDALPSFNLFLPLLDNYERGKGVAEKVTYTEKKETQAFLAHAVASAPMQFLQKVLVAQGKVGAGRGAMKNLLQEIWFDLYARGGRVKDSSGFEHVFIGEEKDGKVTGMHNWLQLLNEERHGRFNFEGHYKPKRRSNTNARHPTSRPTLPIYSVRLSDHCDVQLGCWRIERG